MVFSYRDLGHDVDPSKGWKGDELFVSAIQWFCRGTPQASYGVWPGRRSIAFAVFNDTKGFDDMGELFRVWRGEFPSAFSAKQAIEALPASVFFGGHKLAPPWRLNQERCY